MMQDWEVERLRREARNPLGSLDLEFPLVKRGGKIALARSSKSALGTDTEGLTVHIDDKTLGLEKGSPWKITAKPNEAATVSRSGAPRALTFLGW